MALDVKEALKMPLKIRNIISLLSDFALFPHQGKLSVAPDCGGWVRIRYRARTDTR